VASNYKPESKRSLGILKNIGKFFFVISVTGLNGGKEN
jgi:hypothetical protein